MNRFLKELAFNNLWGRQMRFIAGPRQVGKTTLAQNFLRETGHSPLYYNWDQREVRRRYLNESHFFHQDALQIPGQGKKWVCFDEIHKYPRWKDLMKDFFDSYEKKYQFIVTGSARLDLFRRSGDSLTGRYFLFRMFPLSLSEVSRKSWVLPQDKPAGYVEAIASQTSQSEGLHQLLQFSGFPEPFHRGNEVFHNAWQEEYLDTLVREDLRDLTKIHSMENVLTLLTFLPTRIGSPLSLNSLKEDLEVSHSAIRSYLRALKLTCILFEVLPYTHRINRAVKKEKKSYFFDWTRNQEEGKRFENYCAVELLHRVEHWSLSAGRKFELRYVRTRDKKETDFLILDDNKPYLLVEAKLKPEEPETHHLHHSKMLGNIPLVQVVSQTDLIRFHDKNCLEISADRFF